MLVITFKIIKISFHIKQIILTNTISTIICQMHLCHVIVFNHLFTKTSTKYIFNTTFFIIITSDYLLTRSNNTLCHTPAIAPQYINFIIHVYTPIIIIHMYHNIILQYSLKSYILISSQNILSSFMFIQ